MAVRRIVGIVGLLVVSLAAIDCAPVIAPTKPHAPARRRIDIVPDETAHCLRLTSRVEEHGAIAGPRRDPTTLTTLPSAIRRSAVATDTDRVLEALAALGLSSPWAVELRLEAFTRLSSLEIQLQATLFEVGCLSDQMEAVLGQIETRQRKQEVALTVASIVVGGMASIGSGIYELRGNNVASPVTSIVGGVAAAGLGLAAFTPVRTQVGFPHPRNLLRPLLTGEDPDEIYPPFLFRLLTMPTADGSPTPREMLLADWDRVIDDTIPESQRPLAREVLFGDGGTYDAKLISVREQMFDALESQINAMQRELELLYRFADAVITDPPGS